MHCNKRIELLYTYVGRKGGCRAGEFGDETDISEWDEKLDIILPVEDLSGPSRAMATSDPPSSRRSHH